MLNSRQQLMLSRLVEERNYITVSRFAEEFGISPRTVRHDLLNIEAWLCANRIELKRDRRQGIMVNADESEKQRIIGLLNRRPEYVDPELRIQLLLKRLLTQSEAVFEEILEEFMISRNTLLADVQEMKKRLAPRGLKLIRERGRMRIDGSERQKRKAYLDLLRTDIPEERILHYVADKRKGRMGEWLWNTWFQAEDAHFLFELTMKMEHHLNMQFTDVGRSALILHLLMAMERLRNDNAIRMDGELLQELGGTKEFAWVVQNIKADLERHFGVIVPEDEIGYITQHILGAQKKQEDTDEHSLYARLARQIVMRTEQRLGFSLQRVEQIVQGLAIHLKPAMYRAKFHLETRNPLLGQLEREYGPLLDLIGNIVDEVMEPHRIHFGRDEIGYILIHIGSGLPERIPPIRRKRVAIVCSSGLGTSAILRKKMEALYPQVVIVGEYSFVEARKLTPEQADAVLTMLDLGGDMRIPWLKVSPLLPPPDRERVGAFLGTSPQPDAAEADALQWVNRILDVVERHAQIRNRDLLLKDILQLQWGTPAAGTGKRLTELLPVSSILLQLPAMGWEEAIRTGNRSLRERGLTEQRYEEKLVDMVRTGKHHFIIDEGIAYPHASTEDGVRGTGFCLMTFERPIDFGSPGPPVWLMIIQAAVDKQQHAAALSTLLSVFNDKEWMAWLRRVSSPEEVWNRLRLREDK
jgi:transcriptional antiterminator/mannitol/fructose-specific phosphotransferase system IIA component (Ntr-type)